MSVRKPDRNSIRPHVHSSECGGLGVEVGDEVQAETTQEKAALSLEDETPVKVEVDSEESEAIDEEEEADVPLCLPAQYQLSRSEFLDHCVTHYPFRAWCRHCLEGRGREFGHGNHGGAKEHNACPVVSFDYACLSDHDEVITQEGLEAAGEGAAKILVLRDSKSKAVFAHVVPAKGIDEKGFFSRCIGERREVAWIQQGDIEERQ
jgi:hypothetical protein